MEDARKSGARAERRAMIALVAVFALLVQTLVPTLASAAPATGPDGTVLLCTDHGLQSVPAGPGSGGTAPDGPCGHCICPAAQAAAPPPSPDAVRVAYVTEVDARAGAADHEIPHARAPPRPPGQGPPRLNA